MLWQRIVQSLCAVGPTTSQPAPCHPSCREVCPTRPRPDSSSAHPRGAQAEPTRSPHRRSIWRVGWRLVVASFCLGGRAYHHTIHRAHKNEQRRSTDFNKQRRRYSVQMLQLWPRAALNHFRGETASAKAHRVYGMQPPKTCANEWGARCLEYQIHQRSIGTRLTAHNSN